MLPPIFIAFCYLQTDSSSHLHSNTAFVEELSQDILSYSKLGDIVLVGDFNARLGKLTGDFHNASPVSLI